MSTTVTVDEEYMPTVTLTVTDSGGISATIEVEGLEPTRSTSADERAAGVTSLDPPTISINPKATAARTHRAAVDAAYIALSAAVANTEGVEVTPGGLLMLRLRTAMAMRKALRLAGEDI